MDCRATLNSLSSYVDGQGSWLSDSEERSIEKHLEACPACRSVQQELMQLKSAARELPLHTPPRALWTRIANVVEAELPFNERPTRRELPPASWWERLKSARFTFTLPQLTGVGVMAMALLVFGVYFARTSAITLNMGGLQTAMLAEDSELKAELDRRLAAVERRKADWDPQLRAEFEQHLAKVNDAIQKCRENLIAHPAEVVNYQRMIRALYAEERQLLEDVERMNW